MLLRKVLPACLILVLLGSTAFARSKGAGRLEPIGDLSLGNLGAAASLITAEACTTGVGDDPVYYMEDWAIGLEWYKALIDPSNGCSNAYPFTIYAINMPMQFTAATPITVSVDVETIDYTSIPGCATPGDMLTFSTDAELQVPEAGGYNIWVELDTPITVDAPFFAGFYIANQLTTPASVFCDSTPEECVTYNAWDEEVGWIDLVSGEPAFPGRLFMEVAGMTADTSGGGGEDPPDTTATDSAGSMITLISPQDGDLLMGPTEIWALDSAFSGAIEYVSFLFSSGGAYAEFGRDYSGETTLRDGVQASSYEEGFAMLWDFTYLPEGDYSLRAVAVDTTGDSSVATILVSLEPTPPTPTIDMPITGEPFCDTVQIGISCSDEDVSYLEVYRRDMVAVYSSGVTAINQSAIGDYCSGPAAAAMAARVWYDRGYEAVMKDGAAFLTLAELGQNLAEQFRVPENGGTLDDALIGGLVAYFRDHGDNLRIDYARNPSYYDLRAAVEDEQKTALLGVGGTPGLWLAVDGFLGWIQEDSTYRVSVANPLSGNIQVASYRNRLGYSEISLGSGWQPVDLMVTMVARDWTVSRSLIGIDLNGSDGWSFTWDASGLETGTSCIFRVIGRDGSGHAGTNAFMGEYDCSLVYVPGDMDGNRTVNIADLFALIDFVALGQGSIHGGPGRADVNCDNVINVADVVFYMNYLYGSTSAPCR